MLLDALNYLEDYSEIRKVINEINRIRKERTSLNKSIEKMIIIEDIILESKMN